jgi:hypothetical protein
MEFHNDEIEQIRKLVKEQALNGNNYIACCDNGEKLSIDDLAFFQDDWSANEYCYENSADLDRYAITTANNINRQIEDQLTQGNQIENLKSEIMKPENFEYLKNQARDRGFGEAIDDQLKTQMETGEPTIQVKHQQEIGKDKIEANLHFRKSDTEDHYFFNSFDVTVVKPEGTKEPAPKQTFYVGRDNQYTLEEGYNLLSHRFVNKDIVSSVGEKMDNSWVRLDFKNTDNRKNYKIQPYTQKWGFDLNKALDKFPVIKELGNEADRVKLIADLKKGNKCEITLVQDGKENKGAIVTNPYARIVYVTDENGKKVLMAAKKENNQSENQSQSQNQDQNAGQKNDAGATQANGNTQKNEEKKNRRQGMHQ